jgi:tRNA(Glu) U13 pseudouridine synthase TruD
MKEQFRYVRFLEAIQSSLFGSVLYSLLENGGYTGAGDAKYPFLDENGKWMGSTSELLEIFNSKASALSIDRRQKEWKGSPRGLSTELEKLKTNFRGVGVVIERGREHEGRFINIYLKDWSPFYKVYLRHDRHERHLTEDGERPSDTCDASDANRRYKRVGEKKVNVGFGDVEEDVEW